MPAHLNLKTRLQLSLALVLALSFSLFGLLEYFTLGQALLRGVDEELSVDTAALAARWEAADQRAFTLEENLSGEHVEVLAPDGSRRYASADLEHLHLPAPTQVGSFETIRVTPSITLRLYSQRLKDGGVIVLGESLHLLETSLRFSAGKIVLAGMLTLGLCLLVTQAVLSRGLAPLDRVAHTAQEVILTGDVSQRVSVPAGADNVVQVARSFNSLLDRVQEVLEAQGRLLSDTSHELRNPLMVLQTDLDMLGQDLDPATRQEVVQEAALEVARVTRLVQDLLLLSWAEAHPRVRPEPLRLDELARRCVSRLAPLAQQRQLSVEADDEVWVAGDSDRLEQILRNLLDNSIRYTGPDGRIVVRVKRRSNRAVLAVEDNGCGIAPEHLVHIFERFYRVDPSRSRGSGGAGLGLPLARALAQMHGGDLTARSQPGQGCVFQLELPLA